MHPTLYAEVARAKQAELREAARRDRCCGRGALRRIAAGRGDR
jgi:hypothetical protein